MKQSKYQFNQSGTIANFRKKNEFIDYCQSRYNDCINSRRTYDYYFSFDYGNNWHSIEDFKSLRQTIQNEKSESNTAKPTEINHKIEEKESTGFFTYILYALAIWGGLSLINKNIHKIDFVDSINSNLFKSKKNSIANGNNNELNSGKDNSAIYADTIGSSNSTSSDEIFRYEPTETQDNGEDYSKGSMNNDQNVDYETQPNNSSSNTYQQQEKQTQWVNCRDCNGQGMIMCRDCTGRGSKKCSYCNGKGWKWYGTEKENCNTCGGTSEEKCQRCYGKGNQGRCNRCSGRGQIQVSN